MKAKTLAACLLAAAAVPLAGCSASASTPPKSSNSHPATSSTTSGTTSSKAPGTATPKNTATAHVVDRAAPSEAAKMICTDETRDNITTVLSVEPAPKPVSTWRNNTYTCTYRLPTGPIVLTVHEAADVRAATAYTAGQRSTVQGEKGLAGLNPGAFGTSDGIVVLQKDNDTMRVDTSHLSPDSRLYPRRAAFAYNIAAVVLGCWTGN
ncbi:hypothetical protein [Flexivirga alba]|uniref:DUF3558 domain-containing protein n=1 Tax=Flexivirga alba TaxID=702742 RepID=A0ABW2ALJ4_9MICO